MKVKKNYSEEIFINDNHYGSTFSDDNVGKQGGNATSTSEEPVEGRVSELKDNSNVTSTPNANQQQNYVINILDLCL